MHTYVPVADRSHTKSRREDLARAASCLDAGRRIKDRGRPVDIYIYIYIS